MAEEPDQEQPTTDPAAAEGAAQEQARRRAAPRVNRNWHEAKSTPEAKKTQAKSQKRKTLFSVLAAILALLGIIAAWLFFIHPYHPPKFLSIALTEYPPHLYPVNAFAQRDGEALVKRFENGTDAHDSQEKQLLQDALQGLRTVADKPVVVHLCGFARVHDGTLYLLPAKAQPSDPTTWLAMEEVLRPLRDCKTAHKLLILDISRSLDDPRRGTLPDDIAGAFQNLFSSRDQGVLQVLAACSPGQTSLVSEELSQSVFGYYLDQGLRGYADGYGKHGQRDGRISVGELAAFVRARVERWALRNRRLHQTPILLGSAPDFDLVSLERGESKAKLEDEPLPPYPATIQKAWEVRDGWLADGGYESAPRAVSQLEANLLRLEQRWRGHDSPTNIDREIGFRLGDLNKEVADSRPPRPINFYSLFLKAARGQVKTSPDVAQALRDALADVDATTKPDVLIKKKTDFGMKLMKLKVKPSFEDICWTAFQVILGDDAPCTEQAQFTLVRDLLLAQPAPTELVELAFLQRLAAFKPDEKGWPKDRVQQLLQVAQEGEKAHACTPREWPWVRHALDQADAKRLEGDKLFFAADSDEFGKVRARWDEALQMYKDANALLAAARKAQKARDEALRLLPAYLPCLVAQYRLNESRRLEKTWLEALDTALSLDAYLAQAPEMKAPSPEDMEEQQQSFNARAAKLNELLGMTELGKPLQEVKAERLMEAAGPEDKEPAVQRSIAALLDIDSILATSWPTAAQRRRLWKDRRTLAEGLNKKVRDLDDADNEDERLTSGPQDAAEASASQQEGERAFRARLSLRLLKFSGLAKEKLDPLDKALAAAQGAKADPKAWGLLATGLEYTWAAQLPADLRAALDKGSLRAADLLTRVIHPLTSNSKGELVTFSKNPAAELRRGEAQRYWKWLADYNRRQGQALAGQPDLQKVFEQAAKEFVESAE
jgi:hypothetical protein